MAKHPERGALPHRTIAPRPGEFMEDARAVPHPLLTPVLYADAKTDPDHVALVCPTCGCFNVHLVGVGIVRREDYTVMEHITLEEWRSTGSERWKHTPVVERVRHDSLMLDITCEFGHAAVVELGHHKGILSTRVTRYDNDIQAPMWKSG